MLRAVLVGHGREYAPTQESRERGPIPEKKVMVSLAERERARRLKSREDACAPKRNYVIDTLGYSTISSSRIRFHFGHDEPLFDCLAEGRYIVGFLKEVQPVDSP